jgi:hypothetical protein
MKSLAGKLASLKSFRLHRLGLLGSVFALTLFATDANAAWFRGSISILEVDSTGAINVYFNANTECGSPRLVYVHSLVGTDDGKAMFAALLAWQAQNLQVSVYVPRCIGGTGYGQFDAANGTSQ